MKKKEIKAIIIVLMALGGCVAFLMGENPKAIGFVVRNDGGMKKIDQFVNTVDDVERITGHDFFPALPDDIENAVEAEADINDWK